MSNPQGQWDEPNVRVSGLGKPAVVGLILVVLWSLGQFVPVVSWFSRDGFYAAAATTGTVIPVVLASLALFTRSRKLAIATAGWFVATAFGQVVVIVLLLIGQRGEWTVLLDVVSAQSFFGYRIGSIVFTKTLELVVPAIFIGLIAVGVRGRGSVKPASVESGVVGGVVPAGAVGYASWGSRFGAALLDGLPAGLLGLLGSVAMSATMKTPTPYDLSVGPSVGGVVVMLLCYAAGFGYMIWNIGVRQGKTGQSWGKRTLGISVIGEQSGEPLGVGLSIGRQFAHIVDALPCYLGFLFPLWDAKAQTFADKMIGSIVVTTRPGAAPYSPGAPPQPQIAQPAVQQGIPSDGHQQRMAEMQAELDLLRQLNEEREKREGN